MSGHEEDGVFIFDEPQLINIVDLKREHRGCICLMDYDGEPDDNFCIRVYAYCHWTKINNLKKLMSKEPKKYRIFFIDSGGFPVC